MNSGFLHAIKIRNLYTYITNKFASNVKWINKNYCSHTVNCIFYKYYALLMLLLILRTIDVIINFFY